jgi:hypothetical protein
VQLLASSRSWVQTPLPLKEEEEEEDKEEEEEDKEEKEEDEDEDQEEEGCLCHPTPYLSIPVVQQQKCRTVGNFHRHS